MGKRSLQSDDKTPSAFPESDCDMEDDFAPLVHVDLFNVPLGTQFALKSACKSFALFYFVRFGAVYIQHIVGQLRKNPLRLLRWMLTNNLEKLVGERALKGRVPAVMWGQVAGMFTFIFHVTRKQINDMYDDDRMATFVAGFSGGLSLLFYDPNSFRTLALYMFARLLRCLCKAAESRGLLKATGLTPESNLIKYANLHVFAVASAQIMYSYSMAPHTLGDSYWRFIVRMGPVSAPALTAIRQLHFGGAAAINVPALQQGLAGSRGFPADRLILADVAAAVQSRHPGLQLPIQPGLPTQLPQLIVRVFLKACSQALPLYAALQAIPSLLLRVKFLIRSPVSSILSYILSVARSTVFISLFPTIYVLIPLVQMWLLPPRSPFTRWRPLFWFAGWIASCSLLCERDSRQGELALYALGMGLNCAFNTIQSWPGAGVLRLLPSGVGELVLYSVSMGGLSYFYHHEKDPAEKSLFATVYGRVVRSHNQKVIVQSGQRLLQKSRKGLDPGCKILHEIATSPMLQARPSGPDMPPLAGVGSSTVPVVQRQAHPSAGLTVKIPVSSQHQNADQFNQISNDSPGPQRRNSVAGSW